MYNQATDLQARLKALLESDESGELIARGNVVRDEIRNTSNYLLGVHAFRTAIGVEGVPESESKKLEQAIERFRRSLSKNGPPAMQQQPATTVLKTLKDESARLTKSVRADWKMQFNDIEDLLNREQSGELLGSVTQRTRAAKLASGLRSVRSKDPVRELGQLEDHLGCQGLSECLQRIESRGEELRTVIEAIDQGHEELSPQIQEILEKAKSEMGLPLSEVTTDVLEELDAAGVLDHFVVRRL